jgi:hypothetical protein
LSNRHFDMPGEGSFEERGGWLVNRLAADFSLTKKQAAGIVGNLGYESVGLKTLQEKKPAVAGSRGGYGWAQWTGPRRRAFEEWAAKEEMAPASDQANYGFLVRELRGSHKSTITDLKETATIHDAVFSVGQTYEQPGGTTPDHLPGMDGRLAYAKRALAGASDTSPAIPARSAVDLVKAIQQVLAEGGLYEGPIDGIYGKQSAIALGTLVRRAKEERT